MIDRGQELSVTRQANLIGLPRSRLYSLSAPVSDADLAVMQRIDALHLEHPYAGARMRRDRLRREGVKVGRTHVAKLLRRMGIAAVYRKPNTCRRHPGHKIYPYLLRGLTITRPITSGRWTSPTRIRAASSPRRRSPACSNSTRCSSSGSGARSNTTRFISTPTSA